jgi:predicted transposase/invertase (TIGR01784 family)
MLLAEYVYDTDIAVQRKEAFDDGLSQGISQGRNEGISIGLSQGVHQKAVETAKNFLAMGLSIEQVADGTGLSPDEIEKL